MTAVAHEPTRRESLHSVVRRLEAHELGVWWPACEHARRRHARKESGLVVRGETVTTSSVAELDEDVRRISLVASPSAPFWARRHARASLQCWRMSAETIDTAELLVSELVTNAVKFANPALEGAGRHLLSRLGVIDVAVRYRPGWILIEVTDSDPRPPVAAGADLEAEGGRGLLLVEALSEQWSWTLLPGGRKTVFCLIPAEFRRRACEPTGYLR
jgi:anti-sigma regulatory factor (Ser/Thr protein kinase)